MSVYFGFPLLAAVAIVMFVLLWDVLHDDVQNEDSDDGTEPHHDATKPAHPPLRLVKNNAVLDEEWGSYEPISGLPPEHN